ncbi:hypothetical protein FRB96_003016 [Tulasnella sp. 330]|nr:hypothetical protein FRB96_003016 [Tulasnella sp. 330]
MRAAGENFIRAIYSKSGRGFLRPLHLSHKYRNEFGYQEPDSPSFRAGHAVKRKRLDAFSRRDQASRERLLDRAFTVSKEGSLAGGGIWVGPEFSRFDEPGNLQLKAVECLAAAAEAKASTEAKAKAEAEAQAQVEHILTKHEAVVERARRFKEDKERRLKEAEQHRLFAIEQRQLQAVEDLKLEEFVILTTYNLLQKVNVNIYPGVLTSLAQSEEGKVKFASHTANKKGLHAQPNAGQVVRALIRRDIGPLMQPKGSHELEGVIQGARSSAAAVLQQADHPDQHFSQIDSSNPPCVARKDIDTNTSEHDFPPVLRKHLVRRLLASSVPVTVLDTKFDTNDLEVVYSDFPSARDLLHLKTGDVQDAKALSGVMTSDVDGVIHLAAVSRAQWCSEDRAECSDVNENGTDAVLHALRDLNRLDQGRRWFLLASSRSIHDAQAFLATKDESERISASNAYLVAERILDTHIQSNKEDASAGQLYATALRLPNIYGDVSDHVDRLIPNLFAHALSHQMIQVVEGQQNIDMLYIDDCIDAFILAIKDLDKRSQDWAVLASRTYFNILDVAAGKDDVPVTYLVDRILRLTRSKSPIRYIPRSSSDILVSNVPEYEGTKGSAPRLTELKDTVSIDDGLLRLTRSYLERTEQSLADQIHSTCSQPARSITDTDLLKLDDCSVHITVEVQGQSELLRNKDLGAFMVNQDIPPRPMRTFAKRRESDGKTVFRILGYAADSGKNSRWLGVTLPITNGGVFEGEMPGVLMKDVGASNTLVDWELAVNPEQGTVHLLLAGTEYQLRGPVMPRGMITLVSREMDIWPFRITPVCCKATTPWPFADEDPIDFMVEYQKDSTERPFLASPKKALCSRLKSARAKTKQDLATLSVETLTEPRFNEKLIPRRWVNAEAPPCSNMCSLPTVCIDTGDCQCVLSSCPAILPRNASTHVNTLSDASVVSPQTVVNDVKVRNPLAEMVNGSSWRSIIRPQALAIIDAGVVPRIHVGPLAPRDQQWRKNDTDGININRLKPTDCFSADASMELTLSSMSVPAEESDYTFVPMYQGRPGENDRFERAYEFNLANTPRFNPHRVIVPFTHDWGVCLVFDWHVWGIHGKKGRDSEKLEPYTRWTTAWSTMGDLNSPCYRPAQDVVIPPRGCASSQLFEAFGNISNVRPSRDRRVLVTFKGNLWGTGSIMRQKIMCERIDERGITNLPGRRLITTHPVSAVWDNYGERPSYAAMLNDTIFCVHAMGIAGWAPRLIDAIYAGCIPVVIGHTTQFPFYDMIDWGKISISIETSEIHRLEEILVTRYTIEDVERLQANIILIRDAFVYPLDDVSSETLMDKMFHKRGPLFFALYSTQMRMLTKWPAHAVYDKP